MAAVPIGSSVSVTTSRVVAAAAVTGTVPWSTCTPAGSVHLSVAVAEPSGKRSVRHAANTVGAAHAGGVLVFLSGAYLRRHTRAVPGRTHVVFGDAATLVVVAAGAGQQDTGVVTVGRQGTLATVRNTLRAAGDGHHSGSVRST